MNDTIYYKTLYTLAKTKKKMICEHCGKPIILCDRCGGSGLQIITKCIGKGFVHNDQGHFHHCNVNINSKKKLVIGEMAFPVLTDDEKRRLEHYKGVENE